MRASLRLAARIVVVVALVGSVFGESAGANRASASSRKISVPRTLARTLTFDAPRGRVILGLAPTHIMFSWRGDERTGVRYRTVDEAGDASRWRWAPVDHDADEGRRHYSGAIAVDRPAEMEYRKKVPDGTRMGRVTLDYVNTLDGPERTMRVPRASAAVGDEPRIVTRAEWGANESVKRTSGGCKRNFYPAQQLFVHHTAGKNYDRNGAATMRAIYHFHVQSRGWCDVGYNFVIDWDGTIFEGRWARNYLPWETHSSEDWRGDVVQGAHVSEFNSGSVGVSMMGNFTSVGPPKAMRRSLIRLLAWEADRHNLKPKAAHTYRNPETGRTKRLRFISGHRDAGFTSCPGARLYRQLPSIRRRVNRKIGDGKLWTGIDLRPRRSVAPYGSAAALTGTLTDERGLALAGKTIAVWRRDGRGAWHTDAPEVTEADGSFDISVVPEKNVRIVAVYEGGGNTWSSRSRTVRVALGHAVTLTADGAPAGENTYHFAPGETSAVLEGDLRPNHAGKNVRLTISKSFADGPFKRIEEVSALLDSSSRYTYEFIFPDATSGTTYRVVARMPRDSRHREGVSPPVYLVLD